MQLNLFNSIRVMLNKLFWLANKEIISEWKRIIETRTNWLECLHLDFFLSVDQEKNGARKQMVTIQI